MTSPPSFRIQFPVSKYSFLVSEYHLPVSEHIQAVARSPTCHQALGPRHPKLWKDRPKKLQILQEAQNIPEQPQAIVRQHASADVLSV